MSEQREESVTRYVPSLVEVPIQDGYVGRLHQLVMLPSPMGEWRRASDYDALARRCDRMREALEAILSANTTRMVGSLRDKARAALKEEA